MHKPTTGETIPKIGFAKKIKKYIKRSTGSNDILIFIKYSIINIIFKNFPTICGSILRGKVYSCILKNIGSNSIIEKNVTFIVPKKVSFGCRVVVGESSVIDARGIYGSIEIEDDVHIQRWCRMTTESYNNYCGYINIQRSSYIGPYSYMHAIGKIFIGKNCLFGPRTTIVAGNHKYQNKNVLIRLQGQLSKNVEIEDDVWLSANVTVLGGVRIGEGAVIGAGSVVTKDIPEYTIASGVPAKVTSQRESL